jgi:hypothetical protein
MSEAEILSIRNELTGLVLTVVSVSFGMVSAYIVGLWLFLKDSPLILRCTAFALLSFGLAFMGGVTAGLNALLLGTERAWAGVAKPATGIASFGAERPDYLLGLSLYDLSAAVGGLAFLTIYLALFYLTFFYSWSSLGPQPDRAR